MKLFNRKAQLQSPEGVDLGLQAGEVIEPGEGGPSPFSQDLAKWRFTHLQQSVDLTKAKYSPEAWADGRFLYDLETSLAHAHQEIRDRAEDWSQERVRENAEILFEDAGEIARAQVELQRADSEYLRTQKMWKKSFREIEDEPQEIFRLNSLRSVTAMALKELLLFVFIASEFVITGFVFNNALPLDIPYIGYVLAIGVLAMLMAVPHYLARGIKEGITQHHKFDLDDEEFSDNSSKGGIRKRRQVHREEADDKGFRIASLFVGLTLLALIVPLSFLRASETIKGNRVLWFFSFLFIQIAISGYFFLREWLDHGPPSANLHMVEKHLKECKEAREEAFVAYSDALNAYYEDSLNLLKSMQYATRLDAQIIEHYLTTLHFGRHLQIQNSPEMAPFINGAIIPYLGVMKEVNDERGDVYEPVTSSFRTFENGTARGREWWLNQVDASIRASTEPSPGTGGGEANHESVSVLEGMGRGWLDNYLRDNFGLSRYLTPYFDDIES